MEVTREEFDALSKKVESLDDKFRQNDKSLALLTQSFEQINSSLAEIKAALKTIQEKPAKRWDSLVTSALQWLVTGFLAYLAVNK